MRSLLLASVVFAPVVLFGGADAAAQGSPSADQIIRALRPVGPVQSGTRGIRPASPATASPAAAPSAVAPVAAAAPRPAAVSPTAPQTAAVAPALPTAAAPTTQAAVLSIDLTVQFQSGSAELTQEAMRTLDELGRALSSASLAEYRFRIEGHTDTTGSRAVNMVLSEERAAKVAEYLQSKFGVASSRLVPVGRGQEALKVNTPDHTPEPRNRRVQVINIGA